MEEDRAELVDRLQTAMDRIHDAYTYAENALGRDESGPIQDAYQILVQLQLRLIPLAPRAAREDG